MALIGAAAIHNHGRRERCGTRSRNDAGYSPTRPGRAMGRVLMDGDGAGRRYATGVSRWFGGCCGRSSMVELQPSKLAMRVRFPSPAPWFRPR